MSNQNETQAKAKKTKVADGAPPDGEELSTEELDAVSGGLTILGGSYSGGTSIGSLDPGDDDPRLP